MINQKYQVQPTLINLHPDEYSQEFHYYPFVVKVEICVGSCNTLNDLSNKVCIPNKTKYLNLSVFNMITCFQGINKSKTLTKHISFECKCKLDQTKCNSNQWGNNNKCWWEKSSYIWKSIYFESCICENGKYLASIIDNLAIICDEII